MKTVVLDLETFDPTLKTTGTDAHTRAAGGFPFLAGLFFPDTGEVTLRNWHDHTGAFLRELLDEGHHWIGANIKYDLGWLLSEGVLLPRHTHNNRFEDVLINAPLIDETQPFAFYSLDGQARHYGMPGKPVDKLLDAAKAAGIKCTEKEVRGHLWAIWHSSDNGRQVVEEYLRYDLTTTWAVYEQQVPLIAKNKLERVHELETSLLPILAMMENRGVKVDVAAAQYLYDHAYNYILGIQKSLKRENGGKEVSLNSSDNLRNFIIDRGHKLPETKASSEKKRIWSVSAPVLERLAKVDPLIKDILDARRAEKIAKDFAKGAVIDAYHNGRIHSNINQIIGFGDSDDEKKGAGVRFGRLSMSKPNLQQVPKKDKLALEELGGLGSAMRAIFVAEDGCQLMSSDFSSQEPRLIIHWAETWDKTGRWNAKKIGDMYREDPTISSHLIVAATIVGDMSGDEKKALAKIINLGKGYEMGRAKLITNLTDAGLDPSQADKILEDYDVNFPHVSLASKAAMAAADKLGYVTTYYGRRLHFVQYEPVKWGAGPALPYEEAYQKYVVEKRIPIRRAATYRAFNRIVQGSAADQTKAAMVSLWYDYGILPYLQIHDELVDASISDMVTVKIYKQVMENVMPLTIPSLTEVKLGPNWRDAKKIAI